MFGVVLGILAIKANGIVLLRINTRAVVFPRRTLWRGKLAL